MKKTRLSFLSMLFFISCCGQDDYIHSKEGRSIINRRIFFTECLKGLHKDRTDNAAAAICDCRINKLDYHFTNSQYRKNTINGDIDIAELIKKDTAFEKEFKECFTNTGQTILIEAQSFQNEFMNGCVKTIQKNTEKALDTNRVKAFCSCQLELIKEKKVTDQQMQELSNPNSIFFYEMIYKCGDPFADELKQGRSWSRGFEKDVSGPLSDTIKVLTLNGMTYTKIKIGGSTLIWLFDTGASDLLINTEMEERLKKENIITDNNYLGIGEYEMANGVIDTCRRYKINNIQIGKFSIDNVEVAVTNKGKRIIVGKALFNKFSKWILNNEDNTLILMK